MCDASPDFSPFHIIFSYFSVVSPRGQSVQNKRGNQTRSGSRAVMRGGGVGGGKLSFLLGIVTFRPQPRARSQIPTAASRSDQRSGGITRW